MNSRLNEFVRDFEGRLDISELPGFEELTADGEAGREERQPRRAGQKREAQVAVVDSAI